MGHTSLSELTTTFANNVNIGKGSEVTVLDNKTISVTRSTDGDSHWYDITLDTPFNYNGVDNLVVDFESSTKSSGELTSYIATSTNRVARSYSIDTQKGVAEYDSITGSVSDSLVLMQFVFAGGDDRMIHTGSTSTYPFRSDTPLWRVQMLIPASEINGFGAINGIAFATADSPTSAGVFNISVNFSHNPSTSLVATSWDANLESGKTVLAVANADFNVPAGVPAGAYLWLPVTESFKYNGTDSLVVDITVQSVTGSNFAIQLDTGGSGTALFGSSTTPQATTENGRYNMKLRFKGGSADVITAGDLLDSSPFNNTSNKLQYLYRSPELGSGGVVSGIACRLHYTSGAAVYDNFTVVLGHTANTTLGTTFASNMDHATTIYSGAFSIPAGLRQGDWIEIPLSASFTYDITKNLVVQMSSPSGTAANGINTTSSATRYPNRRGWSNDAAAASGPVSSNLADFRLIFK